MLPTWLNRPPHRLEELDQLLPEGTSPDVPGSPVVRAMRRTIAGFSALIALEMMTPAEADELIAGVLQVVERHRGGDRRREV